MDERMGSSNDVNTSLRDKKKTWDTKIPIRYRLGLVFALGLVMNYWIKGVMSVAIIAMVKSTRKNSTTTVDIIGDDVCPISEETAGSDDDVETVGEFDWDENSQGVILSSYFYGYICTQFLGGYLSQIFGGKYIVGCGLLLAGCSVILSPMAAKYHIAALIITRVVQGIGSGVIAPGLQSMFSNWFVPEEKQMMYSLIFSSTSIGSVISMAVSGVLASYSWELTFYVPGIIVLLWFTLWMFVVYNNPAEHPRISEAEKCYIINRTQKDFSHKNKRSTPYFKIMLCIPFLVHLFLAFCTAYLSYMFLTELPTYTANVLHFNIESSGVISSLPMIAYWLSSMVNGTFSQWLQRKGYFSKITAYRIFNAVALLGPTLCLLGITIIECDSSAIIPLLILTMGLHGTIYGGSISNNIDLGNNHVGFTSGVQFTVANLTAVIIPLITGALTNNNQTLTQWKILFYITMVISTLPYILFVFFGSAEEQKWNKIKSEDNTDKTKEED